MFRAICSVTLLFILALPLMAAEEAKPNTLTPKEVEEGWILLFDGETTFGWQSENADSWTVSDGLLTPRNDADGTLTSTCEWPSFHLSFDYRMKEDGQAKLMIGTDNERKKRKPGSNISLDRLHDGWVKANVRLEHGVFSGVFKAIDPERPHTHGFETKNKVGWGVISLQAKGIMVRNIKLKPIETKPVFNGKDLTGWKKFDADPKRAKSEFSVAKEGWIHLKDGPGDLQTEKEWGDFILQIQCFSNGDKLNSGVFFRCRPNEYQNGYEAQIHNGFTEKAEKEYAIEEYDPETHKLTGTKKEKFQAMDYGTGGIYRRMPARRSVAKDKEWFTMTVAAQGRHIATWVNGIQVVDWIDNRPEADNARNGCKLGKGPISLQGHDATTDLRFRNINIVELPAGEEKKEK
jgi:hypothetical protein